MSGNRRQLGRGLSALLGTGGDAATPDERPRPSRTVPVDLLRPGTFQPRRRFDEEAIEALAQSIREKGVLQPILVRRPADGSDGYEIVAGERRWRASQRAQLHEVPVILRDLTDQDALEIALVENVQRESLSPIEEAEGYNRLIADFAYTQDQLAKTVGKSRSHIANTLRLLGLPGSVRELLEKGAISAGHARALLGAANPAVLAAQVVARGLSVRATERLAQGAKALAAGRAPARAKTTDTVALERDLGDLLGLRVRINWDGKAGTVTLRFVDLDQFDGLLARLKGEAGGIA
ncbi:MAG: ParB/RepB/Spo0J family partition protein [Alphaproteobacteria bacterium]